MSRAELGQIDHEARGVHRRLLHHSQVTGPSDRLGDEALVGRIHHGDVTDHRVCPLTTGLACNLDDLAPA
jgi:hypothetical protein